MADSSTPSPSPSLSLSRHIDELKDLIGHSNEVVLVDTKEFDAGGQYTEVLEAVEKTGDGKARVYRVEHGSTRAEYYIIGLDVEGGRVVGMKVRAVES